MIQKYKAEYGYFAKITLVDIIKETDSMVILPNARKERKETEYHGYFDTHKAAKYWMINKANGEYLHIQARLEAKMEYIEKLKKL